MASAMIVISATSTNVASTDQDSLSEIVRTMRATAAMRSAKPFDINHAVELIRRALEQSRRKAAEVGEAEVAADILGKAPAMQDVFVP